MAGSWTAMALALLMFLAPALGVPGEEMLQDTLKSAIVSFGALLAALLFFWQRRMPLRRSSAATGRHAGDATLLDPRLRGDDGRGARGNDTNFVIPAQAGIQTRAERSDGPSRRHTSLLDPRQRGDDGRGARGNDTKVRWHAVMVLPLALLLYSLASMAWSHRYLAGVETVRWFIFGLLLWLGLNTLTRERLPWLAAGVHAGAAVAALWAVLQFWFDWRFFPQGARPASTFINRNFFAEFAVCALPFGLMLLARARQAPMIALLGATNGLLILAILMTGTRSALIALWLQLLVVLPLIGWLYRREFAFTTWGGTQRALAWGLLAGTVLIGGMVPTGSPAIAAEGRGFTALERAVARTQEIRPGDESLNIRMVMWRATLRMIADRPLAGVGAGAWEEELPLYQSAGSQIETDFYVHNEFLQLVAEFGIVGWAVLALLTAWLLQAAWRTLRLKGHDGQDQGAQGPQAQQQTHAEAPWRAILLTSLLALMVVSNIGFPWRLASTGALFALCLGALAASDARLGFSGRAGAAALPWKPVYSSAAVILLSALLVVGAFITRQAAVSERNLVSATRIALGITASGDPNNPRWNQSKAQMLQLVREGVAINPHYRKVTPMVADELARWGDWANAVWIWESVLSSRPKIVAITTNVARGYAAMGQPDRAREYLARAKRLAPQAPAVRSLEVVLLARSGQEAQALTLARDALARNIADFDLVNATVVLATHAQDFALAQRALELRLRGWPERRVETWLQMGQLFEIGFKDPAKALDAYGKALDLAPPAQRAQLRQHVPQTYWQQLVAAGRAPA